MSYTTLRTSVETFPPSLAPDRGFCKERSASAKLYKFFDDAKNNGNDFEVFVSPFFYIALWPSVLMSWFSKKLTRRRRERGVEFLKTKEQKGIKELENLSILWRGKAASR